MKTKFLNIGLLLAMSLTVVFTSCDNEPERPRITITAENVGGNTDNVAVVKVGNNRWGDYGTHSFKIITEVPFQNNSFTVQLPRTMRADYLSPYLFFGGTPNPIDSAMNLSDENVRWSILAFSGYSKNDNYISFFSYRQSTVNTHTESFWVYADRNVKATTNTIIYLQSIVDNNPIFLEFVVDLNFRRGWNIMYNISEFDFAEQKFTEIITTERPADVNLQWIFGWHLENDIRSFSSPIRPFLVR